MTDDMDDRWWPAAGTRRPFRSEELAYAALGPVTAHRLVVEFERRLESEPDLDDGVRRFFEDLRDRDGRATEMLFLLAAAVAVTGVAAGFIDPDSTPYRTILQDHSLIADAYKFLGSFVVEAAGAFSFTEETFLDYLAAHREHFGGAIWPPPGVDYTRRPPDDPELA